jgi:hypothetical protein
MIVFPILHKLGGPKDSEDDAVWYVDFDGFLQDWVSGNICAPWLKRWIADAVDEIITPIRSQIMERYDLYEGAFMPTQTELEMMRTQGISQL